ncbi:MAG TPA: ABC transporter ATP-binding protein [Bacteroidales bacterium]|nr:ABC transporter ATP-binding protein [Bacteroidales bacterium]
MKSLLVISNLSKKFAGNKRFAVLDFSITVNNGEIVALLGESGCGKTTILRMISGFELPDRGSIVLDGVEVSGDNVFMKPEKRGVGIVFQDYALFPNKTVEQNIAFGLFRFDKQTQKLRIAGALELCGLEEFTKRYPHQLSGGQKQRVALARALAPHPKVLLFDEPFSNIDTLRKAQMRSDIGKILRQTQTTAIFVTHDTRDALSLADRISVIKEGECQQTGTPAYIYRNPVNSYVASFFGKTNLFDATPVPGGFQTPFGFISSKRENQCSKSRVLLSLRPEDFELCNPGALGCFRGKVVKDHYLGSIRELTLEVCDCEGHNPELLLYVDQGLKLEDAFCNFRQKNDCEPGILEN